MDHKTIRHIIHVFFRRLKKLNHQVKKRFAKKPIHLFRVQYKKLRAFLRLLSLETGTPIKLPRKLKKMYRLAGKIRDRQIQHKTFPVPGQDKKEKGWYPTPEEQKQFLSQSELSSIEKELIKKLPQSLSTETIKTFFKQKQETIHQLLQKKEKKDEDLHLVRKHLKDLIYIIQLFTEELKQPLPFRFWNRAENKMADALAHQLGLFNDSCTTHAQLEKQSATETILRKNNNGRQIQHSLDLKNQQRKSLLCQLEQIKPSLFRQSC